MATRKPVSVLPVPVGEATSTSSPEAISGQAADWGAVGPPGKRSENHALTAGWNPSSGTASPRRPGGGPRVVSIGAAIPLFHQAAVTGAPARSEGAPYPVAGPTGSSAPSSTEATAERPRAMSSEEPEKSR